MVLFMKSIIFVVVFCFLIGLAYIDHSKYGIVYNPLELKSDLLENNYEKQLLSAPCSEFGGG